MNALVSPQVLLDQEFSRWGIKYLLPLQELVVHQILCAGGVYGQTAAQEESFSRIVVLPTGFGKTFCFALPIPLLDGPTLIVYPLRSLLFDQARRFEQAGLNPAVFHGHQEEAQRQASLDALMAGKSRLAISTLETLLDHKVQQKLSRLSWAHLVFDEAHVIQQWGKTFRPSYDRVEEILAWARPRQCSAFTATADEAIMSRLRELFDGAVLSETKLSPDKTNLEYRIMPSSDPALTLEYILRGKTDPPVQAPCLVFIRNRQTCLMLCRRLSLSLGRRVRFYHAGLSHEEKKHTEHWFRHHPEGILVSTNAFGLGVDHPGIRTVLHWNLPDSMPSYVQEAGRAGRDGQPARAWVVQDRQAPSPGKYLDSLLDSKMCRRKSVLKAFGEESSECGTCDVCRDDVWDHAPEELQVLGTVKKNQGLFTAYELFKSLSQELGCRNQNQYAMLLGRLLASGALERSKSPLAWNRLVRPRHL